jgi:NAD(P)-dependent dehydrogenase (short-subunit alcohol dehydrogenase family)
MADLGFDGKVAIITGAGGGLGRSHALELAKRGALVVVNDLGGSVDGTGGSETAAQKVVDEIKAAGGEAVPNYDSVATPEGGANIVKTAMDAFGRVDIIINNAGILRDASFKNMTPDTLNPVLDVHLRGAFYVTQPAWSIMRDQGYGRIVNTASGAGVFGNFGQTNYGAAKMGLVGFTRVLAVEGAKNNIKANAIAPVAKTRMTEELLGPVADKLGPEFVTPVVTYLAHESCPVSGEVYSVGGGRVARVFIGVTPGFVDHELSAESVRDHFDQIRDEKDYAVPGNLNEEMGLALKALS